MIINTMGQYSRFFYLIIIFLLTPEISYSENTRKISEILKRSTVYISIVDQESNEYGMGSGVVINKVKNKFFILTNSHVTTFHEKRSRSLEQIDFREAGYDIWIWPHDSNCYPERCMGWTITDQIYWDSNEGSDYAIIMIDFDLILGEEIETVDYETNEITYEKVLKKDIPNLIPIKIGNINVMKELDTIYSAGYPLIVGNDVEHYKDIFITKGEINAFITSDEGIETLGNYSIVYRLGVKGGMSGGPVVNKKGELIAINGLTEMAYTIQQTLHPRTKVYDEQIIPEASKYDFGISIDDIIYSSMIDNEFNLNRNSDFYNYLPKKTIPAETFKLLKKEINSNR